LVREDRAELNDKRLLLADDGVDGCLTRKGFAAVGRRSTAQRSAAVLVNDDLDGAQQDDNLLRQGGTVDVAADGVIDDAWARRRKVGSGLATAANTNEQHIPTIPTTRMDIGCHAASVLS